MIISHKWLNRTASSIVSNGLLALVAATVAAGGVGLTVLYMVDHIKETPGMKTIHCFLDPSRRDCPEYDAAMKRLKTELEAMVAERNRIDAERKEIAGQLAGLRAIETAVDEVTLFETHDDPNSDFDVVVGTVYKQFVESEPKPEAFFCYIELRNGEAGESRNLHFRNRFGLTSIPATTLEMEGIGEATMAFARSACKPFLIGETR